MERQALEKQRIIIRILDIICIVICAVLSDYISMDLMKHSSKCGYPVELSVFIIFTCLIYLLFKTILVNKKRFFKRDFFEEMGVVLKITIILFVSISALSLMLGPNSDYSRMSIGIFVIMQFVFSLTVRCVYKSIVMSMVKKGKAGAKNLIIMTTTNRVEDIVSTLKYSNMWEYRFTGIILLDSSEPGLEYGGIPVVANFRNMYEYVRKEAVDELFISVPYQSGSSMIEVIEVFETMGVTVNVNIQLYDINVSNRKKYMSDFGGYYVVTYAPDFFDPRMMFIKRTMDICGSIIGLIGTAIVTVFLAPVLLIESPGPLFFAQTRIGKNGRRFKMYKFRSMYADAEERKKELMEKNEMNGLMFKMKDDPRVTKVGRFIRKTSIDELPQFWNILKGDMSLVGTRPPTLDEFEQYEAHHKRRVSITPGLTGLWQASGRSDITDFEEVVNLDLQYIDNWSIWLDIKIIFQTVLVVFRGKGAK